MLLHLTRILSEADLLQVQQWLAHAHFVDGKLSAGALAKRVKNNQEIDRKAAEIERLNHLVMNKLTRHEGYKNGALPLHVAAPFYARYQPGMSYGEHVDDPIMGADGILYRSDIAVTIFLNAPETYQGGELVIHTAFGEQAVKLPAGDAVLYPASSRHRVNPVTQGERLVAVTWVQSLVRDAAQRALLYELNQAREKLLHSAPESTEAAQVNAAYMNLFRMWSDL